MSVFQTVVGKELQAEKRYIVVLSAESEVETVSVLVIKLTKVLELEREVWAELVSINGEATEMEPTILTFADLGCSNNLVASLSFIVSTPDVAKTFKFTDTNLSWLLKMREHNSPQFWKPLFEPGIKAINTDSADVATTEPRLSAFTFQDSRPARLRTATALSHWRVS